MTGVSHVNDVEGKLRLDARQKNIRSHRPAKDYSMSVL